MAEARRRPPRRSPDPRRSLGARGETVAAEWYESAGYEVVDRNWRCRDGELDLVVAGRDVVVFCEVKTRRGGAFGAPAEAVTFPKQRRIRGLALRWLGEHHVGARRIRFDVASVRFDRDNVANVEVITDAF